MPQGQIILYDNGMTSGKHEALEQHKNQYGKKQEDILGII